ncbi:hypothetical protein GCM10011362_19010 [Marinobacter halophilus]|nr:hypothetical protein GCM10011362_19010 [Marinobacter halophilus]
MLGVDSLEDFKSFSTQFDESTPYGFKIFRQLIQGFPNKHLMLPGHIRVRNLAWLVNVNWQDYAETLNVAAFERFKEGP